MALSLLLLVGAGLLTQTLRNLQEVDKGFREEKAAAKGPERKQLDFDEPDPEQPF